MGTTNCHQFDQAVSTTGRWLQVLSVAQRVPKKPKALTLWYTTINKTNFRKLHLDLLQLSMQLDEVPTVSIKHGLLMPSPKNLPTFRTAGENIF